MSKNNGIKSIKAREILDSRGNPTIEVQVTLKNRVSTSASVPSGASTGLHEALELRDGDKKRYNRKGVLKAVNNVNKKIAPKIIGMDPRKQKVIDSTMLELDGTENKSKLGANAILGVSLACAKAAALALNKPLYKHIANLSGTKTKSFKMPIPSFNIINGGKHADNNIDFQEFMIFPAGIKKFSKRVQAGAEIFHALKKVLRQKKLATTVGDEGGFAPNLKSNQEALELIMSAIKKTQWKAGKDIFIALDPAASEFFHKGKYLLNGERQKKILSPEEMINYWNELVKKYPIVSIEDGLAEDDWIGWQKLTSKLGNKIQIVGDDFLVTNPERIKKAIESKAANAVLIKYNQIGSLTETLDAINLAKKNKWNIMVSHRSGETTDTFIADLVVGTQSQQIKSGSLSRGERLCKYNRLLQIESEL